MVTFVFFTPTILEGDSELRIVYCHYMKRIQWWGYHEEVGILKLYLLQKILFEIFALVGSDKRNLGTSASTTTHAPWWNFLYLHNV